MPEYTVTTAANPIEGGSVTIGGTFEAGTLVTETATPAEGYQFVSWTDETGKVVSKSASYAFTVTADVTLTANFKVKGTGGQVSDKLIFAYLFDDLDNWHKSETDTDIFETFTVVNWDEKPFNHEVLTGPRSDKYIDTDRTNMPWGPSAQEGDYYLDFLGTYNGVSNTSEMYGIKAGGSVTLPETNTFTLSYDYLFPNSNNQADYGTITLLFGEGEQNYITIKQGGGQIYTVKDGITSYQHETYYSWRMTEDTWYHVTLSFSQTEGEADGRVVIYLTPYDSNGNLLTNRTETITQSTSGQVLKIPAFSSQNVTMYLGTGLNASYTHQAYLDNLYMFSDALTEDEVQEEIGQLNYPIVTSDKVIVLDYGLDVITDLIGVQFSDEISDMELAGIRYSTEALPETGTEPEGGFGTSAQGSYGTAAIENGTNSVRYQLSRMLDGAEVIQFAVKYTYTDNKVKYAYHTLTIIPAKTVYYEDTFVSDNTVTEAGSSQDRTQSDKNVVYGYDNAYAGTSDVNSNGTAAAITDALTFNFTGTGFELIGRTDTDGYMIKVKVKDTNGATKKLVYLNTYYEDGALYQLPLISITGLAHGTYTVELSLFDKNGAEEGNGWTFYLDGVRIFDPLESGDPLTGHYATGEAEAEYQSIRNMILGEKPQAFITSYQNGTVGIGAGSTYVEQYDGTNQGVEGENKPSVNVSKLSDYLQSGPNNELYLTPGNAVAFLVSPAEAEGLLQFGAKTLNGEAGQITVATSVNSSIATNSYTVATRTEMYYSVLSERTAISGTDRTLVVIANTSSSDTIISLTKLKKYGYTFADSMLTNEDFLINCGESGDYQAVIEVLEQIFEGELGTVTDTEGFNIEIMGAQLKKEDAGYAEGTLGIIAGIPIGDYYADMDAISEIGMVLTTSDVYKADVTIGSLTEQQKQEIADLLTANTEKDGIKTIKTTALQYDYTGSSTAAFRTVISNITDVDRTYFVRPYAMINGTPVYGEVYAVSLAYVQEKLGVTGGQN